MCGGDPHVDSSGGLGLLLSRQAQLANEQQRPVVWFRHIRIACWMMPASMLIWVWFLSSLFKIDPEVPESTMALVLGAVLLATPVPLASLTFQIASRPVLRLPPRNRLVPGSAHTAAAADPTVPPNSIRNSPGRR